MDAPDLAKSTYGCRERYQEKEWNPLFNCAKVQGCLLVYWRNSLYAKNQDVNGAVWRCLYFDRMSPLRGLDEAELCLKQH